MKMHALVSKMKQFDKCASFVCRNNWNGCQIVIYLIINFKICTWAAKTWITCYVLLALFNFESRFCSFWVLLNLSYRVSHIEVFFLNWLWQIEICKLDFLWRWFWHPEIMKFEFQRPVFKEMTHSGLNSLWQKKLLKFTMIFHDSTKNKSYSKDQNKAEFKNLDTF